MIVNPISEISFDLREDYDTDAIVVREIWEENVYEIHDTHFNRGGVVVDIGANIGAFSIYAAHFGAKVFAVEPEPNNLEALNKNISLNNMQDKIVVCNYGISDHDGIAVINDLGGGSTIKDDGVFGSEINLITFDNFLHKNGISEIDVLKIDVEGSEPDIILAASKESLHKCKNIAIELDLRTGNQMGAIVQKLSETHHVRTMGSWERGGMIWAWIY